MDFKFFGLLLTFLALAVFVVLRWLDLPVGNFSDWLIAVISFWWLLVIITFPWNIHFQAREVMIEAAQSTEKGIAVKQDQVDYANTWVKRSLFIAIGLHLISALILYLLAVTGISAIGYIGSAVALLLTFLRPIVRAYRYLVSRLATIQHEIRYPREDVVTLRGDLHQLTNQVKTLEAQLDTTDKRSWAAQQEANLNDINRTLNQVRSALDNLRAENQTDHRRLAREAEQALAQISEDGRFLNHVREIIRFVKDA